MRPFISGHVANSMAAEVIALLHSLLMAPESNAAQIWTTTAEKVSVGLLLSQGNENENLRQGHRERAFPS